MLLKLTEDLFAFHPDLNYFIKSWQAGCKKGKYFMVEIKTFSSTHSYKIWGHIVLAHGLDR